jgi:hypothetical protein
MLCQSAATRRFGRVRARGCFVATPIFKLSSHARRSLPSAAVARKQIVQALEEMAKAAEFARAAGANRILAGSGEGGGSRQSVPHRSGVPFKRRGQITCSRSDHVLPTLDRSRVDPGPAPGDNARGDAIVRVCRRLPLQTLRTVPRFHAALDGTVSA